MRTIFNIGLETNSGSRLPLSYALLKLSKLVKVENYKVRKSNTERTLIALTREYVSNKQIERLCDDLEQDAIALKRGDIGYMVHGRNAIKDWGDFKEKYFIL